MTIVAAASAWGCAPGHIAWGDGDDQLRTALWVEATSFAGTGGESRWVFLSNGIFDCSWPQHDEPSEQVVSEERWHVSRVREGALHLLLELEQPLGGQDWEGTWDLGSDTARHATASYLRVEEVAVSGGSALTPEYQVLEASCETDEPSGHVDLSHTVDHELEGTFSLATSEASGHFKARRCEPEDYIVDKELLPWHGWLSVMCSDERR